MTKLTVPLSPLNTGIPQLQQAPLIHQVPPNSDLLKVATSALQHSADELDMANFLATCTSESKIPAATGILPTDLVVIPWGGIARHGITLVNTCPGDNWLMIFQALVKSGRMSLDDLAGAGNVITTALSLIGHHEYGDAKLACLSTVPAVKNRIIDLYGSEAICLKLFNRFWLQPLPLAVVYLHVPQW